MTHDVFICHSSKDRTIANAICSKLEQNRIRCWIAPRDVIPGREYAQSIIEAISGSKLTVLVFSDNSNQSPHVHREIERTVSHGIPILPFRVDDVIPSPALEYFISDAHWLDAITPPMEQHLQHLAGTVRLLLNREGEAASSDVSQAPATSPQQAPRPQPETRRPSAAAAAKSSPQQAPRPQPKTRGPSAAAAKLPTWWRWAALGAALGAVAIAAAIAVWVLLTLPATVIATVKLGEAITLNDNDPGVRAAITAVKVIDPTTSTVGSTPAAGSRYLAVQFQIQNIGTVPYNDDDPGGCAKVLDTSGHQFGARVTSVSAGPLFPMSGITIRPGQKAVGYLVFQVPTASKIAKVQFTMDGGYALESGQWTVPR